MNPVLYSAEYRAEDALQHMREQCSRSTEDVKREYIRKIIERKMASRNPVDPTVKKRAAILHDSFTEGVAGKHTTTCPKPTACTYPKCLCL